MHPRIDTPRRLHVGLPVLGLISLIALGTAQASPIYEQTFDGASPVWPGLRPYKSPAVTTLTPAVTAATGTVDAYTWNVGTASKALKVTFKVDSGAGAGWWFGAGSGLGPNLLNVPTPETTANRLNLSFDLRASQARCVRVRIASYTTGATPVKTGESDFLVTPPIANVYKRYSFDLPDALPGGNFNPASGRMEISLNVNDSDGRDKWSKGSDQTIELDNINYTRPTYYVDSSYAGPVFNGGLATPFKSPQAALNFAVGSTGQGAGSVIMIRAGAGYQVTANPYDNNLSIGTIAGQPAVLGSPSKWIVIRNFPDERPLFTTPTRARANIRMSARVAYVEIRGLELKGRRQDFDFAFADANRLTNRPELNSAGIDLSGELESLDPNVDATDAVPAHHISIRDNIVYDNTGTGVGAGFADYVLIEDNHIYNNSWWTQFATSGLNIFQCRNFHSERGANDYRILLLRNFIHDNKCLIRWERTGALSDGNGIIIDRNSAVGYVGKTLIQNNVTFRNGGSGIHAFLSRGVVIANNTAYHNSQVVDYGEIFSNNPDSVQITNNIMVAAPNKPIDGSFDIGATSRNNLYWRPNLAGGVPSGTAPASKTQGVVNTTSTNTWGDPIFQDAAMGDFRLPAGADASLAKNTGNISLTGAARIDHDLKFRPNGTGLDRGALEAQ